MEKFLYELHCHTAQTSPCGRVDAAEAVQMYRQAGYAGIVITDHLCSATFEQMPHASWEEKIQFFLSGYRKAKEQEDEHFRVFLGMELRFYENDNDYLVYGVTEQFLLKNGDLMALNPARFHQLAQQNGLLFFQAHPFRFGLQLVYPKFLDGIEGYNANPRHNSNNDIALAWAKKYGLRCISGSDFHQPEDLGRAGAWVEREIQTNQELVEALKTDFDLKTPDAEPLHSDMFKEAVLG